MKYDEMTDTQRLDWVVENKAEFREDVYGFYILWNYGAGEVFKTGREALKAAIDGENE